MVKIHGKELATHTANPSKKDFVIALANTEADACKFYEFVSMLSEISGMESTVKNFGYMSTRVQNMSCILLLYCT